MNELIPELENWNNGDGINVESWIQCVGDYEHAIGYAELFWPTFEIYDGCVFSAGFDKTTYEAWMKSTEGNKTSVQVVMNHLHILDLFPNVETDPSGKQVVHLGRKLKEIWEAKLRLDFPDYNIVVSFPEEEYDDLLDYEITFFIQHEEEKT